MRTTPFALEFHAGSEYALPAFLYFSLRVYYLYTFFAHNNQSKELPRDRETVTFCFTLAFRSFHRFERNVRYTVFFQ